MTAAQFLIALVAITLALCAVMAGAWVVQQRSGNSGWVDTIWSFGLGAVAAASALVPLAPASAPTERQIITAVLIGAWALRLGIHLAGRSRGITNDPRYAEMERQWGKDAPRMMFRLLQIQAIAAVPLALAAFVAAHQPEPLFRAQDIAALILAAVALLGESTADRQLRAFTANPANKGKVCDVGLWRWSRHPNYFFEWLVWVAYPILAIDIHGGYEAGYLALLAPAVMYWLLVHVSGIPLLEAHMIKSRGEAFLAYRARTSAFFPWPPRG